MQQCQNTPRVRGLVCGLLLAVASAAGAGGSDRPEPVFTRYAGIYPAPTLDVRAEYFSDKPMEEMQGFDGYGLTLDFTWPINAMSQVEVLAPVYTSGDGEYDNPGSTFDGVPIDVEGYGGVRQFLTLIYERRFPWLEDRLGVHAAWLAGAGQRAGKLDAEYRGTRVDRFNHTGRNYQLGLKLDGDIRGGAQTLLGNLRYVMFRDADDINTTGGAASFEVLYVTAAVVSNRHGPFRPVLEAILEHDFEDYTAFSLAPELLYSAADSWDLKAALPLRLTGDGQEYALELELTLRF